MICIRLDNVLENPDDYVCGIMDGVFSDVETRSGVFRGIQVRQNDLFESYIKRILPNYNCVLNFVRKSPRNQKEPNYIHKDDMHGDKTVILYLNKKHPSGYGTTLYNEDKDPVIVNKGKYNSVFIFDSHINHSRNIKENFDTRLIQVMFLKLK